METPLRRAATPGSAPFEAVQSPEDPSQLPSAAGAAASSAARGELEMRLLLEKAQLLDTLVEQNGCSDGAELGILIAQMRRENREHRLRHLDAAADDDDAPPTADAPPLPLGDDKFPDDILALICSVLGLRELGRLACAARRFTEPTLTEPGGGVGGAKLSPIEEGARLRLAAAVAGGGGSGCGGASGGAAAVRLADETWMRALWRVEYRLQFTSCGPAVVLSEEGTVATKRGGNRQSAVCAEHPMVAGAHYVEMTLLEKGYFGAFLGVVGQGFDAAGGGRASDSAQGWLLGTGYGNLCHAGSASSKWEGRPQRGEIKQGDVVGLLLDLGQRTLSLYLDGARRGVMVAPGMKNEIGGAVASLAGPLRWAVEVSEGASVRIERRPAPGPVPSAEEVAAAVAWNEAN